MNFQTIEHRFFDAQLKQWRLWMLALSETAEPAPAEGLAAQSRSAALGQFLKNNERRALRLLRLGTGNTDDALDLLQDAMLAFANRYGALPKYENVALRDEEWPKLFHTILNSKLTDFHRRNSVLKRVRAFFGAPKADAEDVISLVSDDAARSPDRTLASAQIRPVIERALRALPHRQRQAFLLRTWEGFDGAQTAEIMGCTEGSVKTHLFRALTTLRSALAAWEPGV